MNPLPDLRREVLADYLDQRVYLTGVFERLATNKNPHKPFKVALLQDSEVELSRGRYDLGHIWIQHAETLAEFRPGDRVRCSCRVGKYTKTFPDPNGGFTARTAYSLSYPVEVKLLSRPVAIRSTSESDGPPPATTPAAEARPSEAPPPPPEQDTTKIADPVQLILEVKELVQKVGGWERLVGLKEAVAAVGGWERVTEIQTLAEAVGGWERLEQLLSMLKL